MRPTSGPFNSRAKTLLGNDVCTYIVEPTTSGAPSWPRNVPVENVHAGRRFLTLSLVIWFNVLNRVQNSPSLASPTACHRFAGEGVRGSRTQPPRSQRKRDQRSRHCAASVRSLLRDRSPTLRRT